MIPDRLLRMAGLGALGVAPGTIGLYLLLVFAFHPTPTGGAPGSGGGIDAISWWVLIFAMLVPLGLAAAWHVVFGRQLLEGRNSCPGV